MNWFRKREPERVHYESRFTTGDVLRLKGGGPRMTVLREVGLEAARATGYPIGVHCTWITAEGVHNEARFYDQQLEKVPE